MNGRGLQGNTIEEEYLTYTPWGYMIIKIDKMNKEAQPNRKI